MIIKDLQEQGKRNSELESLLREKECHAREKETRLRELESKVVYLESQNDFLKNDNNAMRKYLETKDETICQLQDKLKERLDKEQKTVSRLNDDLIAIMDENMDLQKKKSRALSDLEGYIDALKCTVSSMSDVGSAISTASSSSFGPSTKKMKITDTTNEHTLSSSPVPHMSPSTFRSLL